MASTETVRGLSSSSNSEAAGSIGTGGSGVVVNDPAEVAHATQQMRRLSVSFRDTQQHAETIQHEIAESGTGATNTAGTQQLQTIITQNRRHSDTLDTAIENIDNGSQGLAAADQHTAEELRNLT